MTVKIQLLFIIGFLFFFREGYSKTLPNFILQKIKAKNITDKSVVIVIDSKGCTSCTIDFYKDLSTLSEKYQNNVYCFVSTNSEALDLEYILNIQEVTIPTKNIIIDKELLGWFAKKAKAESYILTIDNEEYSLYGISSKMEGDVFSYLDETTTYKINIIDTIVFDFSILPTTRNKMDIDDKNIYMFNESSGNYYICNQITKNIKTVNLISQLNKDEILNFLKLNKEDYELTMEGNFNSTIPGEKFINGLKVNKINNKTYLTYYLTYTHRVSGKEYQQAQKKVSKAMKKILSKDSVAITYIHTVFLSEFDSNYNILNNYLVDSISSAHYVSGSSGVAYNNKTNEFLFNIWYYHEEYTGVEDYNKKNYVAANFKLNEQKDKVVFHDFISSTRPKWYGRKNVLGNYSNGEFISRENDDFFYLYCYPFALDVRNNIKFEIPELILKEINKIERNDFLKTDKPGYFTLGICSFSKEERVLLFRGEKSMNIYAATFNQKGQFLNYSIILEPKSKQWLGYARYINNLLYIPWIDYDSPQKKLYLIRAKVIH